MIIRSYLCPGCGLNFSLRINLEEHCKNNCTVDHVNKQHGHTESEAYLKVTLSEKQHTTYKGKCHIAESLGEHCNFKMYITLLDHTEDGLGSLEVFLSSQLKTCKITRSKIKLATSLFSFKIKAATDPGAFSRLSEALSTWYTALRPIDDSFDYSFLNDLYKNSDVPHENIRVKELVVDDVACPTGVRVDSVSKSRTGNHKCELCGKEYQRKTSLYHHMNLHSQRFQCGKCGKSFHDATGLQCHADRSHPVKFKYICNVCQKPFRRRCELTQHAKSHLPDYRCHCIFCDAHFKSQSDLKAHIKCLHGADKKEFACLICLKSFKLKYVRDVHERSHNPERLFKCVYPGCLKRYKHNRSLNIHMNKHYGLNPYECAHCKLTFGDSHSRDRHESLKH